MQKILLFLSLLSLRLMSQEPGYAVKGRVFDQDSIPLHMVTVFLKGTEHKVYSDEKGLFEFPGLPAQTYTIQAWMNGYDLCEFVVLQGRNRGRINLRLTANENIIDEVVVTGTLKEVGKSESPVNIDIISPRLMQRTAVPNLFEATSLVNGVKPQINCNVCNTGDIHINGMEGPYTLILIDGMPIVSGLSSVYGLMGIPAGIMERLEIAKGPAAALYGSEAMGGTINLITKNPSRAPRLFADFYHTSYGENNFELSKRFRLGKRVNWLTGLNTFYFNRVVDNNGDGFTDLTLQNRISVFNKISIAQKHEREFNLALRYVAEDRWGGENNWNPAFRGGDSVYGESIKVQRCELISAYQWPLKENINTQISYNFHDQNSVYGLHSFIARQSTAFVQTFWNKNLSERNEAVAGLNYKNIWYDDNTPVTSLPEGTGNKPDLSNTLGLFVQDEHTFDNLSKHKILAGIRIDHHNVYKFIVSPRIAYKWTPHYRFTFRFNLGTGFRVVNVFTEDHAALSGSREVVFKEQIKPERSLNGTMNVVYKMPMNRTSLLIWDASVFDYHFSNKILANYNIDPNKVVYANLDGYAYSRGASVNIESASSCNWKLSAGVTYADVQNVSQDSLGHSVRSWQVQTPRWSGNFLVGYQMKSRMLSIDLSGNWYGTQRLPVLPNDYRPEYSQAYGLVNLQVSKTLKSHIECYAGVKNLLNFVPSDPLMRPFDPFDKHVNDPVTNPNAYTFDTAYNYAPLQGIRFYFGLRFSLN
ncbi:MAG TPA: TonB-dependent receptor [Bacteroidia bacterium]|nr:TonB-dependent receptor [Bacteroidia bacterium]